MAQPYRTAEWGLPDQPASFCGEFHHPAAPIALVCLEDDQLAGGQPITRIRTSRRSPALPRCRPGSGTARTSGSPLTPEQRPIVKIKIEEFDEQRFGQSRPWDPQVRLPLADLHRRGQAMVNPVRLASARSKVGPAAVDELLDEVVLDVLVDLSQAFLATMAALMADEEAELQARIRQAATALTADSRRTS